jgi:hypothetical protein
MFSRVATAALMVSAGLVASGCTIFGSSTANTAESSSSQLGPEETGSLGVNAYLWRATLDTLSFMPLLQADSNGGVIVTDWYSNPNNPGERMKLTVSILDQDLRADAMRVAGSRQINQNGTWVDAPIQAATIQKLEEIILTKARDLRRAAIAG